jgi:hypothetical protein
MLEKYRLSGRIKTQNTEKAIKKGFRLLERAFIITLGPKIRLSIHIKPDHINLTNLLPIGNCCQQKKRSQRSKEKRPQTMTSKAIRPILQTAGKGHWKEKGFLDSISKPLALQTHLLSLWARRLRDRQSLFPPVPLQSVLHSTFRRARWVWGSWVREFLRNLSSRYFQNYIV